MYKKNRLIIKLFLVLSATFGSNFIGAEGSFELDSFYKFLNKYRMNAPWVERELISLSLEDFELAFKEVVDILTKDERRWFYFCDKPEDFVHENYWHKCLWQCMHYDLWISKVYVDLVNSELIYKNDSEASENTISLLKYWSMVSKSDNTQDLSYHQFMVFYLDCLSNVFCESIDNAYQFQDDDENYKKYINSCKKVLILFEKNLKKIKSSKYFPKYRLSLNRFKEILSLLEQENLLKILGISA